SREADADRTGLDPYVPDARHGLGRSFSCAVAVQARRLAELVAVTPLDRPRRVAVIDNLAGAGGTEPRDEVRDEAREGRAGVAWKEREPVPDAQGHAEFQLRVVDRIVAQAGRQSVPLVDLLLKRDGAVHIMVAEHHRDGAVR